MHILLRNYPLYLCLLIIFMNEKVLHMKIHLFLLYFKVGYYNLPIHHGVSYGGPVQQNVTEACKGSLRLIGNQPSSANAEGSLTARETSRAGTKVGVSDPVIPDVYKRQSSARVVRCWVKSRNERNPYA